VAPPPDLKQKILKGIPSRQKQIAQPKERPGRDRLIGFGALSFGLIGLIVICALAFNNIVLWRQVNQLRETLPAQGFQIVNLASTEFAPEASGILVISANGKHGTLVVNELPDLDSEHEYQLWLIKNGQRTSGGVFSVGEDGYGSLWVGSKTPLADYSGFGITIEPEGGSPGPTGDKVLGGEL
jgi:anti-sigma-K factor RskA